VIPLQVMLQIRQAQRLISCEGCGRILITEDGPEF
jgi:predicted  nucleic acid-binding Zn-ribbon protein